MGAEQIPQVITKRRISWIGLASVGSLLLFSLQTASLQLIALMTLTPNNFGLFSIMMLIYGLAVTTLLSLISEPWSIQKIRQVGHQGSWPEYFTSIVKISMIFGGISLGISLLTGHGFEFLLMSVTIILSAVRFGTRYFMDVNNQKIRLILSDCLGFLIFWSSYFVLVGFNQKLTALVLAWLVSIIASSLIGEKPVWKRKFTISSWIRLHWKHARPLTVDSLMIELGTTLFSFVLVPVVGINNFGLYRSVFNTSFPTRAVMLAARSSFINKEIKATLRLNFQILWLGAAIISGLSAYFLLLNIQYINYLAGSALSLLSSFALPVAIFIGASLVGNVYAVVGRLHWPSRMIILYRVIVLSLTISFTLCGWILFQTTGLIWSITVTSVTSALVALNISIVEVKTHRRLGLISQRIKSRGKIILKKLDPKVSYVAVRFVLIRIKISKLLKRNSSKHFNTGVILPASFGSLGDSAMLEGTAELFKAQNRSVKFLIPGEIDSWRNSQTNLDFVSTSNFSLRNSGLIRKRAWKELRQISLIVIGADAISGDYNFKDLAFKINVLNIVCGAGNDAKLVNFSMPMYPKPMAIKMLSYLDPRVEIWARDADSRDRFQKIIGRTTYLSPDVGAMLKADLSSNSILDIHHLEDTKYLVLVPNAHFHSLGELTRKEQLNFWIEMYRSFQSQFKIVVMSHDLRPRVGDIALAEEIYNSCLGVGTNKPILIIPSNSPQAKLVIAKSAGLISGRLHACIAGLSTGVPTVGIEYLDKFQGQFNHYEGGVHSVFNLSDMKTPSIVAKEFKKMTQNITHKRPPLFSETDFGWAFQGI